MKRDYYEILEVDRNATPQEIKAAYRKMAVQYHPDRNPGDTAAEEQFKLAAEAYSVLSNPDKRAQYDRFGHVSTSGGGFGGFDPDIFGDFSDILGDFFGFGDIFGSSRRRRNRPQRGHDLRYDLTIDFEEAAFGVSAKIKIPRARTCEACSGTGADPAHPPEVCSSCRGQGQVRFQQGFFTIARTCPTCHGSGKIVKEKCSECDGQGLLQKEKVLEIRIPAGVDNGARLRIPGEGESGANNGPPGDLYVVISVREHPFFRRQNENIYCEIPISFPQAALGAELKVPTLYGEEKLKIPEGTQPGTVFRLKGKGVESLNGRGKGDQLIAVSVVTPTKLSRQERELYEKLDEISDSPMEKVSGEGFFNRVKDIFG